MSLSREELLNWVDNHVVYGKGLNKKKNDCGCDKKKNDCGCDRK